MKRSLGKHVSLVLALILMLSVFTTGIAATDSINDHLVLHYDFEGADILDAMKDKAPTGTVADDIAPIAGAINFSGLTVDPVAGSFTHTQNSAGLRRDPSTDIISAVTGESTWFVRTKLERKDDKQYFFLVEMRTFGSNSVRPFAIQYDAKNKKLCACISEASTPSKAQNFGFAYDYDYSKNEYLNIAVSVGKVELDGKQVYRCTLYASEGLPKTAAEWTKLGTGTIGEGIAVPTAANKLCLASSGSAGCALGVTLDDVRLYNRSLTLEEIASIIPTGSFDGYKTDKVDEKLDVQYVGYQLPEGTDQTSRRIRFVAGLKNLSPDSVGMQICVSSEAGKGKSWEMTTGTAYRSIKATDRTVTAAKFEKEYLYTAVLENIPADLSEITFEIRTFAVTNGVRVYGKTNTVTVSFPQN